MKFENLVPSDRYISKQELQDLTGLSERAVRQNLSDLKKQMVILSFSSGKGYRKVKPTEEMTKEEMLIEQGEINHCLNEYKHRIKDLKKSMRKLVARAKVLDKELGV